MLRAVLAALTVGASPVLVHAAPDRPVTIEERGVSHEGQATTRDLNYDARLLASIASAQGAQGALDGGWTVSDDAGVRLYSFQLVDPGYGPLEGAWRNLRRQGVQSSGLLDSAERQGGQLILRFTRRAGAQPTTVTLSPAPAGAWTGQMLEDGQSRPVTMRRN